MKNELIFKVGVVITLVLFVLLQSIIGTIGCLLIGVVLFILVFIVSFIRDRKGNNKTNTRDRISTNTALDLIKNCTLDEDNK